MTVKKSAILNANGLPMTIDVPVVQNSSSMKLSEISSWDDLFGGKGTGGLVSSTRAMQFGAVFSCVRLISFAIASMSLKIFERSKDFDEEAVDHNYAEKLRLRPNRHMSALMFWRTMTAMMLLKGNAFAWLDRNKAGRIMDIWPAHGHVAIDIQNERLIYRIYMSDGYYVEVDQNDILHIPGSVEWDGLRCMTPIKAYSNAVGIGLEADRFARDYFANDETPGGYISYEGALPQSDEYTSEQQKKKLREDWEDQHRGAKNRHKPAILTNGGKFNQIGINAEDAQLLDTRRFQVQDIARIFGVAPHMIGEMEKTTSFGTGLEGMTNQFLAFTLNPHMRAIEQEIDYKIFGGTKYYVNFDEDDLSRTDIKTRAEADQILLGGSNGSGIVSINEARRKRNLPPLKGEKYEKPFVFSTNKGMDNRLKDK